MTPHYVVVFDANNYVPSDMTSPIGLGVGLFILSLIILGYSRRVYYWIRTLLACISLAFACTLVLAIFSTKHQRSRFLADYRSGNVAVASGVVTNYEPMPKSGHGLETFDVDGTHFAYSDFIDVPGFHQTAFTGGPIRPGRRVRLTYIQNYIARVEVLQSALEKP